MPESSLSVAYPDLRVRVAHQMGYGTEHDDWTARQEADIEMALEDGIRQFYYPPPLPAQYARVGADRQAHEWSFLNPTTTLTTEADTREYDAPDDFGALLRDMTFPDTSHRAPIREVAESRIRALYNGPIDSGAPRMVAVRPETTDGTVGQRHTFILWPQPDAEYVLTYAYKVLANKLTDANPYPYGGAEHAQTILESCLQKAEEIHDDLPNGPHRDGFFRALAGSISADRKKSPDYFGYNADGSDEAGRSRLPVDHYVLYNGVLYDD